MTWASIIAGALRFFNALAAFFQSRRDEELGRLKERERVDKANEDLRARIDRADPDSVSDDEIVRR
jgi:hypothetical protein